MALFTLKIKLNSWQNFQEYREIESISKLVDLLHNLLGTSVYDKCLFEDLDGGFTGFFSGTTVKITSENYSGNFLQEIQAEIQKKNSDKQGFHSFFKKVFNPFRWLRHSLFFAIFAMAIGIGLSFLAPALLGTVLTALFALGVGVGVSFIRPTLLSITLPPLLAIAIAIGFSFLRPDFLGAALPALTTIAALGIIIGLPMLLLAGLVETILEYQQAKKDLYEHCHLGKYIIFPEYGFFNYLGDVICYWHKRHPAQATMIGFGVLFFITAVVLTVPYCIDQTGVFSFMSTVFDPIIHFLSQVVDTLAAMPYFDFLSVLHEPMIELGIAAGLFTISPLAIPLTLKNLMQGGAEISEALHCYEEENAGFVLNDENMRTNPAFNGILGNFIEPNSAYGEYSAEAITSVYQRERELVIK